MRRQRTAIMSMRDLQKEWLWSSGTVTNNAVCLLPCTLPVLSEKRAEPLFSVDVPPPETGWEIKHAMELPFLHFSALF